MIFNPTIPNRTITTTENQIQLSINPFIKSQVAIKNTSGLNPIILDGNAIHRLKRITTSSFTECSHVALFDILIPSDSLIPLPLFFFFFLYFPCHQIFDKEL
jgi:hypothetical protein